MKIRKGDSKQCFVMFLNRDGLVDELFMRDSPVRTYYYEDFRNHRNEWFDLLHERYEMWVSDLSGHRPRPEPFIEEIKRDFASDGTTIELSHKYHGKWLVIRVWKIDEEPPKAGNCNYLTDNENECEKPDSPVREDIVDYPYLCNEHYEIQRAEQKEWHDNNREHLHRILIGQGISVCDYCGVDMEEHQKDLHNQNKDNFHKMLIEWGYLLCEYCLWRPDNVKI